MFQKISQVILLGSLVAGCGVTVGGRVDVVHTVNFDQIEDAILRICLNNYDPNDIDYSAKVAACQAEKFDEWLDIFTKGAS